MAWERGGGLLKNAHLRDYEIPIYFIDQVGFFESYQLAYINEFGCDKCIDWALTNRPNVMQPVFANNTIPWRPEIR